MGVFDRKRKPVPETDEVVSGEVPEAIPLQQGSIEEECEAVDEVFNRDSYYKNLNQSKST